MPTYKEQYDKIIQAYFRDEIKPLNPRFCFCGTLCDNDYKWAKSTERKHNDMNGYKGDDFVKMERTFFRGIRNHTEKFEPMYQVLYSSPSVYEDGIFEGMCAALDVLKEIHRARWEDVDGIDVQPFVKRQLTPHD